MSERLAVFARSGKTVFSRPWLTAGIGYSAGPVIQQNPQYSVSPEEDLVWKWVEEDLASMKDVLHQMRVVTLRQANISATVKGFFFSQEELSSINRSLLQQKISGSDGIPAELLSTIMKVNSRRKLTMLAFLKVSFIPCEGNLTYTIPEKLIIRKRCFQNDSRKFLQMSPSTTASEWGFHLSM